MAKIVQAVAVANNEVAFLAWQTDPEVIPGLLGFHIVRELLDASGAVTEERALASWVAFRGQHNPSGLPQNTTVWPVQKYSWRDLTLRQRRDGASRRPSDLRVRYRIRAVGAFKPGMVPVTVEPETHVDAATGQRVPNTYTGTPLPLGFLTRAVHTNVVEVTSHRAPFTTTFTNGILSTQFLLRVLKEDGAIQPGELEQALRTQGSFLRNYLSGDVLPLIRAFFQQTGGRFHAALYELEDVELLGLLKRNAARLELILSDAGSGEDEDGQGTAYDTRNAPARAELRALADKPRARFRLFDRMFNGTGHIGHNKFVVWVDDAGQPQSVLTGSTNWTWSGVAGQSNNAIRIDDPAIAAAYLDCWKRLRDDVQPVPSPLSARNPGAGQSDTVKTANQAPVTVKHGRTSVETWFSPNMPGRVQPSATKTAPALPPPDMARLFTLMRQAKRAIFFLVFMPSRGGLNSVVSQAVELGLADPTLDVVGAISDTQAMWGYEPASAGKPASSPHVFQRGGVNVVRATALTDKEIGRPLGDFQFDERLTEGRAIIHDKILVIDPTDALDCVVAFGSHNLGYRASYANDENLMVVRGHRALALAYATHVLDVHDHYRFRAAEAEAKGKPGQWDGFLDPADGWQAKASRRMARLFAGVR